ncbi:MAG: cytochrome C [Gammaproteobacteria bacterium]
MFHVFQQPEPYRRTFMPPFSAVFMKVSLLALTALFSSYAVAVPSFSRQTGMTCTACHTTSFGPNLTQIGRDFKLNGYVAGGGKESNIPPVSAMLMGSFTHTDSNQPGDSEAVDGLGYHTNNNTAMDEASLFYAGRIWKQLGAFVQLTYNGLEDIVEVDNSDIRFADKINFGADDGQEIVYGISLNNNPTVQDLWNTTPVWGFPYAASGLAPSPAAATLIQGGLGGQVGGGGVYMMWNNLLYAEAGAYASFSNRLQTAMGTQGAQTDGAAPYWRIALQHQTGGHYVQFGTFGMRAQLFPERIHSAGSDLYSDLGVDANYQFLGNMQHIFEFKATYIREDQNLNASQSLGFSANDHNTLNTLNTNIAYTYDQTYSLNFGYFNSSGSKDPLLYGSPSATPDSEGFIAELDYIPFGKAASPLAPWLNLRFALQYTAYTKFDGNSNNYDNAGRNASDNNTLYLNGWLIF